MSGNMTELLVGAVVGTALWGAIGVGVGAIVPIRCAVISCSLGLVVENSSSGSTRSAVSARHASDSMMAPLRTSATGNVGTLSSLRELVLAIIACLLKRRDVN